MSFQIFNSLVGTLISSFLPYDFTIKSLSAQLITQTLNDFSYIKNLKFFKNFLTNNYEIFISKKDSIYEKMEEFIITNYIDQCKSYGLISKKGNINYEIINKSHINTILFNINFQNHKIFIKLYKNNTKQNNENNSDQNNSDEGFIIFSKTASINKLKEYIVFCCQLKKNESNTLKIFRSSINSFAKTKKIAKWEEIDVKTNKTPKNTILSDDIEDNLYKDIENFLLNENWYNSKGLPYKRGYILDGPPGTGIFLKKN